MKWFTDFAIDNPVATLLLLLLTTVGMAWGISDLEADHDTLRDLPDNLPAKQLYDRIGEMFPSKEMVFVGLESDKLWTAEGLHEVDVLTRAIEDVPVVQQVISPTNATVAVGTPEGMLIRDAAAALPETDEDARALRDFLLSQESLRGTVVSEDGQVAAILVFLAAKLQTTESKAAGQIAAAVDAAKGDLTVHPAGRPLMNYYGSQKIGKETGMLASAAIVLMTVLLGLLFLNFRGVLLPVSVVIAAVLWTMGGMGWIHVPMTHSTEALPILLFAIGVADGVHIVQAYMVRAREAPDRITAVRQTMDDLRSPVIMTSITSAVGFLALNTSGVRSIMILGLLTAFGIMVALVFSLSLLPAALALLPMPRRARRASVRRRGYRLQRIMVWWGDLLVNHTVAASAVMLAFVALAVFGSTRVGVETSLLANFPKHDPIYQSSMFINEHFAGVTNVQVVFEGDAPNAVKDPDFLREVQAFEDHVATVKGVGGTVSVVPFLRSMSMVLHGGDPAWDRLPDDVEVEHGFDYDIDADGNEVEVPVTREVTGREVIDGYFSLFEMNGRAKDLSNMVSGDYSSAKVTVFLKSDRKKDLDRVVTDIRAYMDENLEDTQVEMTGMAILMLAINDLITYGQGASILVSLVLVFLITSYMFRSATLGLFNVVPLFAALFFNFGVMGLFGLDLNLMTMGVASMAIGVGVDFAIHFVHRYRVSFAEAGNPRDALRMTFEEAGVAILMNMVAVAGGFLTLLLASFKGVMTMGLLISLIMAFSAVGALTILPILFLWVRPKAIERFGAAAAVGLLLIGVALPSVARAEPGDGRAFMEAVLDRNAFQDMVGRVTLTLTAPNGNTKVRVLKMASRDNDQGETDLILRMEEPADMRGNGFLVLGRANADDDRYIYVPAMGRVSRIVGSGRGGSFMSSDFSYEDIGSPDLEDWVWTLAGTAEVDGHACQVVEAVPASDDVRRDTGYTKVVYYVDEALKTSRAADFYDKQGAKFKQLQVTEIQDLNGVPFGTDMTMTDLGNGHTSRMKMEDLAVDQGVDPLWFTNRALQKGF